MHKRVHGQPVLCEILSQKTKTNGRMLSHQGVTLFEKDWEVWGGCGLVGGAVSLGASLEGSKARAISS